MQKLLLVIYLCLFSKELFSVPECVSFARAAEVGSTLWELLYVNLVTYSSLSVIQQQQQVLQLISRLAFSQFAVWLCNVCPLKQESFFWTYKILGKVLLKMETHTCLEIASDEWDSKRLCCAGHTTLQTNASVCHFLDYLSEIFQIPPPSFPWCSVFSHCFDQTLCGNTQAICLFFDCTTNTSLWCEFHVYDEKAIWNTHILWPCNDTRIFIHWL